MTPPLLGVPSARAPCCLGSRAAETHGSRSQVAVIEDDEDGGQVRKGRRRPSTRTDALKNSRSLRLFLTVYGAALFRSVQASLPLSTRVRLAICR